MSKCTVVAIANVLLSLTVLPAHGADDPFSWPQATRETRPWAYWWWMGSAVDKENLSRVLEQYRDAGMGGMHIIPIYGVKGKEEAYIEYLSPDWMEMLAFAVTEADRRDLGVDMSTGTGWPFGGPQVGPDDAASKLDVQVIEAVPGQQIDLPKDGPTPQAVVALSDAGECVVLYGGQACLEDSLAPVPERGKAWKVYVVRQLPTGQQVKRSAPGGQGNVLDPYSPQSLRRYLARFDAAFADYAGPKPRSQYHDSFEYYNANWTDALLAEFRRRRGYDLLPHLSELLTDAPDDAAARVTSDYRETVAELLLDFTKTWADWAERLGCKTRNQAHGSPGNILDLYAAADIPETEIFGASAFPIPGLRTDPDFQGDRPSPLMIKFASSSAHVAGKPLVASESCTWLAEHFRESLAQAKPEIDQLFVGGVNHVIYHGMIYSPPDDPWPGWLFYASTHFGPSSTIWRDLPEFNVYIARCQSVLQSGAPDNDVLLYFPVYDVWHDEPAGAKLRPLQVHNISGWLQCGGLGATASLLWERGYGFDYVSDRLLMTVANEGDGLRAPGGEYRVLVLPACRYLPLDTLRKIMDLARGGATIIASEQLPISVPGYYDLEKRQAEFDQLLQEIAFVDTDMPGVREAQLGTGRILSGSDYEALLAAAGVRREAVVDSGVRFIRRKHETGHHYFLSNFGSQTLDGWTTLGVQAQSAVLLDPRVADRAGVAAVRTLPGGIAECYLQLAPGESCVLRTFTERHVTGPAWPYRRILEDQPALELTGPWSVTFLEGGPELPENYTADRLESWTMRGGTAETFAGTARYEMTFELGSKPEDYLLDLGRVCESARVYINDQYVGALFSLPFRVPIGAYTRPGANTIAIEVTNLAANRIRDMDRRGVPWKKFHDANFVNIRYKPFDASKWPLMDSGLLGPVRLLPAASVDHGAALDIAGLGELAPGWHGAIVAEVDQSYVGWDVEIGDADNDGKNEILTTGCPDSRLYCFKYEQGAWETRLLASDLAHRAPAPGMGLVVKVVDLNGDGRNELVLGTGQEGDSAGPAFCYVLESDGRTVTRSVSAQALLPGSLYTHNAAFHDLDGDEVLEILSAYCGSGEITRFDIDKDLIALSPRQLYNNQGSGEDSFIADIDNDGEVEYLTCDCYREDAARVLIFEFDEAGELEVPPRLVIDGYEDTKCFNCSLETGDVDNDGRLELIVAWKRKWGVNDGTIVGYRVDAQAVAPLCTFAKEDPDLDLGYGEKMMCVADADNDGRNDLVVTTRGEPPWNGNGLGHVFLFRVLPDGQVERTLLMNFHPGKADAVWPAVGDADNDGRNEIALATGVGHREHPGVSHVVLLEKE